MDSSDEDRLSFASDVDAISLTLPDVILTTDTEQDKIIDKDTGPSVCDVRSSPGSNSGVPDELRENIPYPRTEENESSGVSMMSGIRRKLQGTRSPCHTTDVPEQQSDKVQALGPQTDSIVCTSQTDSKVCTPETDSKVCTPETDSMAYTPELNSTDCTPETKCHSKASSLENVSEHSPRRKDSNSEPDVPTPAPVVDAKMSEPPSSGNNIIYSPEAPGLTTAPVDGTADSPEISEFLENPTEPTCSSGSMLETLLSRGLDMTGCNQQKEDPACSVSRGSMLENLIHQTSNINIQELSNVPDSQMVAKIIQSRDSPSNDVTDAPPTVMSASDDVTMTSPVTVTEVFQNFPVCDGSIEMLTGDDVICTIDQSDSVSGNHGDQDTGYYIREDGYLVDAAGNQVILPDDDVRTELQITGDDGETITLPVIRHEDDDVFDDLKPEGDIAPAQDVCVTSLDDVSNSPDGDKNDGDYYMELDDLILFPSVGIMEEVLTTTEDKCLKKSKRGRPKGSKNKKPSVKLPKRANSRSRSRGRKTASVQDKEAVTSQERKTKKVMYSKNKEPSAKIIKAPAEKKKIAEHVPRLRSPSLKCTCVHSFPIERDHCGCKIRRGTTANIERGFHYEPDKGLFFCVKCLFMTDDEGKMDLHVKYEHEGQTPFVCPACFYIFRSLETMNWHFSHEKEICLETLGECIGKLFTLKNDIYGCNICSFTTSFNNLMHHHIREAHDEDKFTCPTCKEVIHEIHQFNHHLKMHKAAG